MVEVFVNRLGVPISSTVGAVMYPSPMFVILIAVTTPEEFRVTVAVACANSSPGIVLVGAPINTFKSATSVVVVCPKKRT